MSHKVFNVACIGECMVEMAPMGQQTFKQQFAGDTYNTAVYLKRQFGDNLDVSYITGIGLDALSQIMLRQLDNEAIDTSYVKVIKGRHLGLYLVENDASGERYFQYWRSNSAARVMFQGIDERTLLAELSGFDLIYLSGITLAILDKDHRALLLKVLRQLKGHTQVAFDPNYRPTLWQSLDECQQAFRQIAKVSSFVLSTSDDDLAVWGLSDFGEAIRQWHDLGAGEVIIKDGGNGCHVSDGKNSEHIAAPKKLNPMDTTGAGDSFCAGYIGTRLAGDGYVNAALMGHVIAAQVIMQKGGIIEEDSWIPISKSKS